MDIQASFELDLQRWLAYVYERLEGMARGENRRQVESIIERQNRVLIVLVLILAGSLFLLPLHGGAVVIGALVLLYLGAIVSGCLTALRLRALGRAEERYHEIRRRREATWHERPALGPTERAQLVRIMNLSRLSPTRAARSALEQELLEARKNPGLANWPALREAEVLLREPLPPSDDD